MKKEIIDLQKIIETNVSDLTEIQKIDYRKKVALATKVLQSKLGETAIHEFVAEDIINYCNDLIESIMNKKKEPVMPDSVFQKRTSKKAKPLIMKIVLESFELAAPRRSVASEISYNELLKSSTVSELKVALKAFRAVLDLEDEIKELKEMNNWLTEQVKSWHFDDISLDEDEKERMFDVLEKDDEHLAIAMKARNMKYNMQMSEREIASVLNIPRSTLKDIIKKFDFDLPNKE